MVGKKEGSKSIVPVMNKNLITFLFVVVIFSLVVLRISAASGIENCNNGIDDTDDGDIDMNDPDCYSSTLYNWDTSIHDEFSDSSWYNPSANGGADLACGDDVSGTCSGSPAVDCDYFNYDGDLCTSLGCTYTGEGGTYTNYGVPQDVNNNYHIDCREVTDAEQCASGDTETDVVSREIDCDDDDGSGGIVPSKISYEYSRTCQGGGEYNTSSIVISSPYFNTICSTVVDAPACDSGDTETDSTKKTVYCISSSPFGGKYKDYISSRTCQRENVCSGTLSCAQISSPESCSEIYVPGCSWATDPDTSKDAGFITLAGNGDNLGTPAGAYFCRVDSSNKWMDATNNPYKIVVQGSTHFISNGESWSYCDASGGRKYGQSFAVDKYETFSDVVSTGERLCTNTLSSLLTNDGINVETYDGDINDYITSSPNEDAVCVRNAGHKKGYFFQDCGGDICRIKDGQEWISPEEYFNNNEENQPNWCALLNSGPDHDLCDNGGSGDDDVDNTCTERNILDCADGNIDASKTCEEIVDPDGSYIGNPANRICAENQYCSNGFFVHSADDVDNEAVCCYGETASCVDFSDDLCVTVGGNLKPDYLGNNADCFGKNLSDQCCIGNWEGDVSGAEYPSYAESFICYPGSTGNDFKECCGEGDICNNQLDSRLFAIEGVPADVLIDFNTGSLKNKFKEYRVTQSNPVKFTKINFRKTDWSNFKSIEFDMAYITTATYLLKIVDSSGSATVDFDVLSYATNRAGSGMMQHIKIPLNGNINWGSVETIQISIDKGSSKVYFDNFRLTDSLDSDYEEKICTGVWKTWIDNLDGSDGDRGFIDESEPSKYDIAPYQNACDASRSYGWTGNLCCGDDTGDGNAETYVDVSGACWEGSIVSNDQTVASARNWEDSSTYDDEKRLLFYGGKLYACGDSDYSSYTVSFDGVNDEGTLDDEIILSPSFSVVGSWMCFDSDGWLKSEKVNRARLLATELRVLAAEKDYDLLCGDYKNILNYVTPVSEDNDVSDLISNACILKTTSFGIDGNLEGDVILGLIAEDKDGSFYDLNKSLAKFISLKYFAEDANDDDEEFSIDCSNVPSSPDESEMFTECDDYGNNNFHFYYNEPFNMILVSDKLISGSGINNVGVDGFFVDAWDDFKDFISNLFSRKLSYRIPVDFEKNKNVNNFYISKRGPVENAKTIVGSIISDSSKTNTYARVEYTNFANSVKPLADALNKSLESPFISVTYFARDFTQTIYATTSSGKELNWKTISSVLRLVRLVDGGTIKNFGNSWGNYYLDVPEVCDIDESSPDKIIFADYANGECSEYNSIYDEGLLGCNEPGFDDPEFENGGITTDDCSISLICGNGYVQEENNEECDDGNDVNEDACLETCIENKCGDNFVNVGVEECDDGNLDDTDLCTSECKLAVCGDGFVLKGERLSGEECDDGNLVNGDGCDSTCLFEPTQCVKDFQCSYMPGGKCVNNMCTRLIT